MREGEAFEGFCRAEYARVARTAFLITGEWQEALDVTQETFVRAFERWRTIREMDRPDAWVHRVAANLAISSKRRARLRIVRPKERERIVEEPELPDPQLREALASLTPAQRAVIVLRFYEDWSVSDVGEALGKRPGTVRALTEQGMARLRGSLTTEGVSNDGQHR